MNYYKYLRNRLNRTQRTFAGIDEQDEPEILLSDINDVRATIFDALDYCVNHFPGFNSSVTPAARLYFPIIPPDSYDLMTDSRYLTISAVVGRDCADFVQKAYGVIERYQRSILYLDGAIKHRNPDKIEEAEIGVLQGTWQQYGEVGVTRDMHGNFVIGGGLVVAPGANVDISNSTFSSPQGTLIVDRLKTAPRKGNIIVIHRGGQDYPLHIKPFLHGCISALDEIVEIWNGYRQS